MPRVVARFPQLVTVPPQVMELEVLLVMVLLVVTVGADSAAKVVNVYLLP